MTSANFLDFSHYVHVICYKIHATSVISSAFKGSPTVDVICARSHIGQLATNGVLLLTITHYSRQHGPWRRRRCHHDRERERERDRFRLADFPGLRIRLRSQYALRKRPRPSYL